tara:strand:+ start:84333 stop:84926 length:594 start_codon:yes stop_codon:yes gene_type:complete
MLTNEGLQSVYLSIRKLLTWEVSKIVPPKEVEDIVQEAYVKVCQVKNEISSERSFLLKTAKNLALNYLNKAETRLSDSIENDLDESSDDKWIMLDCSEDETYNIVASNEEFAHFSEAVRALPVQCRRAFVLKKIYGYTQKEIAKSMRISESTVEKHIALGIERCTYFMKKLEDNPREKVVEGKVINFTTNRVSPFSK